MGAVAGVVAINATTQARTAASDGSLAAGIYDEWIVRVFPEPNQRAGHWLSLPVSHNAMVATATLDERTWVAAVCTSIAQAMGAWVCQCEGTTSDSFQLDRVNAGPILMNDTGSLAVRNGTDTDYESVIAKTVELTGSSAVEMRVGQTGTRGDGLTIVHQGTGTDVWYGWDESAGKFGVSTDAGSTWTYLGTGVASGSAAYDHLEWSGTEWLAVSNLTIATGSGIYGQTLGTTNSAGSDIPIIGGSGTGNAAGGKAYLQAGLLAGTGAYGEAQMRGEDGTPVVRVTAEGVAFWNTAPTTQQTVDYDDPAVETLARTSANVRRVWDALIALGLITGTAYDFGA